MGLRGLGGVLGTQQRDVGADRGVISVLGEEVMHASPRVGEQHLMNELDRGCGALDVEQDGSNVAQRVPSGMYVGPQHTGWKPWSVPLFV